MHLATMHCDRPAVDENIFKQCSILYVRSLHERWRKHDSVLTACDEYIDKYSYQ
jgi:hypothetical protein